MTTPLPDEFAGLLTTALRRIKADTNKNLDVIQDELGYALDRAAGGSFIAYLRRGNVPTDTTELESLSKTLFYLRALDEAELQHFMRAGGHPNPRTAAQVIVTMERDKGSNSQRWNGSGVLPAAQPTQPDGAFVAGPPVTRPRQFFGRERELRRIFGWWGQIPMSHVALVGPKRSGKTSLLHYLRRIHNTSPNTLRAGQKHDWLPNAHSYRWAWIDFQDARMHKLDLLLRHILSELGIAAPDNCTLDIFMDILTEPHRWKLPAVVIMDDIDAGLRVPELSQPLWDSLRALASSAADGNLAFIASAHDDPARLAAEQSMTSRFFNIFNTVPLGPLTIPEARMLIASGVSHASHMTDDDDESWILETSGRWPALLQILCDEWRIWHDDASDNDRADKHDWRNDGLRRIDTHPHLKGLRSTDISA